MINSYLFIFRLIISRRSKMSAVQPVKGKRKLIDDVMEKELTKKLFGNTEPSSESEGSFSESGSESDGDIPESGERLDEVHSHLVLFIFPFIF